MSKPRNIIVASGTSGKASDKKQRVHISFSRSGVDGSLRVELKPEDAIIPEDKANELLARFFEMEDNESNRGRHLSGWATSIEIDE
jgi:hypothetical protein